ncbi:MAG TPA: MerR family DNA-binding protein [Methylomirabilota bacterium]|nr:MerR family DNA-binding protein [Methylomirabilota bacterium]
MGQPGLRVGQVVARSGVSRKALRLYESVGILAPPRRTAAGYRMDEDGALALLAFVVRARQLGFTLAETREIVVIRREGGLPCPHVRVLVRRKAAELERTLRDLSGMRRKLRGLLRAGTTSGSRRAAVCPHIERAGHKPPRSKSHD